MRKSVLLAVLVLGVSNASAAKLYKWVDKNGQVHYTSSPPPEAAAQGTQRLNDRGIVVEHNKSQAEASKEAAMAREIEAKQRADAKQAEEDRKLLNSVAGEDEIKLMYTAQVELIDQQIAMTKVEMDSRQKSLDKLVARAADAERAKKPVNEQLKTMINSERAEIERQRAYVTEREQAKLKAKSEYETKLARYREVLQRQRANATSSSTQ
jgi:hypothetical protein